MPKNNRKLRVRIVAKKATNKKNRSLGLELLYAPLVDLAGEPLGHYLERRPRVRVLVLVLVRLLVAGLVVVTTKWLAIRWYHNH